MCRIGWLLEVGRPPSSEWKLEDSWRAAVRMQRDAYLAVSCLLGCLVALVVTLEDVWIRPETSALCERRWGSSQAAAIARIAQNSE